MQAQLEDRGLQVTLDIVAQPVLNIYIYIYIYTRKYTYCIHRYIYVCVCVVCFMCLLSDVVWGLNDLLVWEPTMEYFTIS